MKNNVFFSLFRFVWMIALLALLAMLYWSSLLQEEDLKAVKKEIETLKEQLEETPQRKEVNLPISSVRQGAFVDEKLANLLQEDPFYEKVLPKLLGSNFKAWGTRKTATVGKPDNLHPFSNFYEIGMWRDLCTLGVSKSVFGHFEKYAPSAAFKVEERKVEGEDAVEYWVHLREGLLWQPLKQEWFPDGIKLAAQFLQKKPLTAHDFKFRFDLIMNSFVSASAAVALRQFYADVLEFKVLDDLTFLIRWKTYPFKGADGKIEKRAKYIAKGLSLGLSPLPRFVYQYYPDGKKIVEEDQDPLTYRLNSTFAQVFMEHWAKNVIPSCGAMNFDGMSDQSIRFKRNADFYTTLDGLVQKREVQFKQAVEGAWQAFKQGDLDNYNLSPEQLLEYSQFITSPAYLQQVKAGLKINRLDYIFRSFNYIGWNQKRPLFESKKVRQAMTMAIDRPRIIQQIVHGMGIEITAPFYPFSNAYDPSIKPWPFDPQAAKRMLEQEGFADLDGDGILEKKTANGVLKFEFALTYFVKNPTTRAICEYIATALKEIGVKCNLNGVEMADMSALFDDKNFDAYLMGWVLADPPEDPRLLWHSSGATEKGSLNAIGFANPKVDEIIEQLTYENNPEKRIKLYHAFVAIIHEEAPYTFLYTPRVAMVYRDYLQNVFLPVDRQDLVPGATVAEPVPDIFWLKPILSPSSSEDKSQAGAQVSTIEKKANLDVSWLTRDSSNIDSSLAFSPQEIGDKVDLKQVK